MCRRDRASDELNSTQGPVAAEERRTANCDESYSWRDLPMIIFGMLQQMLLSAWGGQALSQLTLVTILHWVYHSFLATTDSKLSSVVLALSVCHLSFGYALLMALYRHSVRIVFNSQQPKRYLPSFRVHLALLKPLEIIVRYITARLRVLPDVIVLGEVRCGTTTMCQYLASLEGCHEPFCLWKHPELDRKETFFFAGHYLGIFDPSVYSMCFPLSITRFVHRRILGRPFFTFEGCAQYLTSPSAPYLIAKAYKDAGQPPPILIACVRDPVDQAVSWYKYEKNAIAWGKGMGLSQSHPTLRPKGYPPNSLAEALSLSLSDDVNEMYDKAEEIYQNGDHSFKLPDWAMTWPGGQMSGIGRSGKYAANIQRYEDVFKKVFDKQEVSNLVPPSSKLSFVNVVPLETTKDEAMLTLALKSLIGQVNNRSKSSLLVKLGGRMSRSFHRNASTSLLHQAAGPTTKEKATLVNLFAEDTLKLESMCGMDFGWNKL